MRAIQAVSVSMMRELMENMLISSVDMNPGNVFFYKSGEKYRFAVIDINRIRFCRHLTRNDCCLLYTSRLQSLHRTDVSDTAARHDTFFDGSTGRSQRIVHTFRKLLAFLLCMASILGLLPAQAFAMSVGQTASSWLGDQYVGSDGNPICSGQQAALNLLFV